ncbi:MAG TPA: outer membrane beta-barrel protein [Parafilimonas sp.]|nr:outer membrane beta-barrel protein [Parafilimonas sp.]
MKRILLAGFIMLSSLVTIAQTDTTGNSPGARTDTTGINSGDTVRVGNFLIVRKKGATDNYNPPKRSDYLIINIPHKHVYHSESPSRSRISTNYLIFDLGFANYRDKTDYSSQEAMDYLKYDPANEQPFQKEDLKLIPEKTSNVNIWWFMQKLSLTKDGAVSLKYGLGLEMYNIRYKYNISYNEKPPYIYRDTLDFSKNKLYIDYATIPFMLNINPGPDPRHGLSMSIGMSAGYRLGSHTKQISDERGKVKNHGDMGFDPWRVAYVAEVGLGPVRVYGSYSITPLHDQGLKQYPYVIGVRFSNW